MLCYVSLKLVVNAKRDKDSTDDNDAGIENQPKNSFKPVSFL